MPVFFYKCNVNVVRAASVYLPVFLINFACIYDKCCQIQTAKMWNTDEIHLGAVLSKDN